MKYLVCLVLGMQLLSGLSAQSSSPNDLPDGSSEPNTDTARLRTLTDLGNHFLFVNTDSSIRYVQQALLTAKKIRSVKGEADADYLFAGNYWIMGDYAKALQSALEALRIYEQLGNTEDISNAYRAMASIYRDQGDYNNAILYSYRCKALAEKLYPSVIYTIIGSIYEKFGHLDSALVYMNKANESDIAANGRGRYGYISFILGNIYSKMNDVPLAVEFYRKGITLTENQRTYKDLIELYNGMAQLYRKMGRIDSSTFYAEKSLVVGRSTPFLLGMLETSSLLTTIYKSQHNWDSTMKYMELTAAIKDTLFSQERNRQFQNLVFKEQLHQQEADEERLRAAENRRHNIQLAGIAAFLPLFFGLILLLSRRKVRPWVVEFMGILGLLLCFEFISLLIHPYIEEFTNHTPVLMILFLTAIAAILVPMHHRLEGWVKTKLVHKTPAHHK